MNGRVMGIMQITRSLGDIEYKSMKEYYWKMEFDVVFNVVADQQDDLILSVPDICKEPRMRDVVDHLIDCM